MIATVYPLGGVVLSKDMNSPRKSLKPQVQQVWFNLRYESLHPQFMQSSQLVCRHRRRQLAVVAFDHQCGIAHLLAQCVYVSATLQQRQRGVGVP